MRKLARIVCCVFLAWCAGSAIGCGAIAGWWAANFAPPKKIPAEYEPPKDKKVLVFVDDVYHRVDYHPLMADLAERLNQQLVHNWVARSTIDPDRVEQLIADTPYFSQLTVSDVGRRLGADLVLYVQIDRFQLRDRGSSTLWRGLLQVTVRVVDAETSKLLWPLDQPAGRLLPLIQLAPQDDPSSHFGSTVAKQLATKAADQIAKLFYDHEIPHEEASRPEGDILDE